MARNDSLDDLENDLAHEWAYENKLLQQYQEELDAHTRDAIAVLERTIKTLEASLAKLKEDEL